MTNVDQASQSGHVKHSRIQEDEDMELLEGHRRKIPTSGSQQYSDNRFEPTESASKSGCRYGGFIAHNSQT
jgi:hypothetical protein